MNGDHEIEKPGLNFLCVCMCVYLALIFVWVLVSEHASSLLCILPGNATTVLGQ